MRDRLLWKELVDKNGRDKPEEAKVFFLALVNTGPRKERDKTEEEKDKKSCPTECQERKQWKKTKNFC